MRRGIPLLVSTTVAARIATSFAFVLPTVPVLPMTSPSFGSHHHRHHRYHRRRARRSASVPDDSCDGGMTEGREDDGVEINAIPSSSSSGGMIALPPIGASSFWDRIDGKGGEFSMRASGGGDGRGDDSSEDDDRGLSGARKGGNGKGDIIVSENAGEVGLVSSKFQLQYTCKVCDTRNTHSVTRMAYRNGVVIAVCRGCNSKHLIADNFGWNKYAGGFDYDNGITDIEKYMASKDGDDMTMSDLVKRVSKDVFDLESILYKDQEGTSSNGGRSSIAKNKDTDRMDGWG